MCTMQPAYDNDGVLVGHYGRAFNNAGQPCKVFIPRRDEDIEAERATKRKEAK